MTVKTAFSSFTSGQVSSIKSSQPTTLTAKAIEFRSSLEIYQTGLRRCENWLPLVAGPLLGRSGFGWIASSDTYVKICPFAFNSTQLYLFAFSDSSCDIFRNDALVATITTPWTAAELPKLRWAQQGDTWLGFHQSVAPTSIKRNSSDTSWTVSTVSFSNAPTFDFGAGAEAAWSGTRGYPACGIFFEDRLLLAGTTSLPETIWGSIVGSPFDFNTATGSGGIQLESDSFSFDLAAGAINSIQEMAASNTTLFVHTSLGEWVEDAVPFDATSVDFKNNSRQGMISTGIRAQNIDTASVFVDRQNNLRALSYDYLSNQYLCKNLSTLTPNLLSNPTQAAYLRGWETSNLMVIRNSDDTLNLLTIDGEQNVKGWSTFSNPSVAFKDLCVLDSDTPALYALVSYNSHTYLTKFTTDCCLDLYLTTTNGTPQTAWSGASIFASKTVRVIGDGMQFDNVSVDGSGDFVLPVAVSTIFLGIAYTPTAETLPLTPNLNGQIERGEPIRKVFADVSVRGATSVYIDGRRVQFQQMNSQVLDQAPETADAMKRVRLTGIGTEPTFLIECRDSLPALFLGLIAAVDVEMPEV